LPKTRCGPAALAAALLALPAGAAAQEMRRDGFVVRPYGLLQLDLGTNFGHSRPGGPDGGFNPRRARLGLEGSLPGDLDYALIWDFGGTPGSRGGLYEASLAWTGLDPLRVTAGVFKPSFSLAGMRSSSDLLFLERPAVVEAASGLGAGSGRVAAQVAASGERWHAAAALTGGGTGPGEDSAQRGATARLAGLALRTEELTLHLGLSGLLSFRPPRDDEGRRAVGLSEPAELALDRRDPPLDTGSIGADSARAGGVELGLGWHRLQGQAELYGIEVTRDASAGGGTRRFGGWYAQAGYTILGRPRTWEARDATWSGPEPEESFNPAGGRWGAVEIGARISELDLSDRDIRGGRQRVHALALGWHPAERLAVLAQYQWVQVTGAEGGDRRFQAAALRAQLRF
jgi:phosphate-selective porin OprO/OprP